MLNIHISNRLDILLNSLHNNIKNGSSPLKKTTICVQTAGMQRWVGLELAKIAGISANLDFIFPAALIKRMAEKYTGRKDLWIEKEEMAWLVFAELLHLPHTVSNRAIISYLKDDADRLKAFRLAEKAADVLDQYQLYRPQMILKWLETDNHSEEERWQAELFRKIYKDKNRCKTYVLHNMLTDLQNNGVPSAGGTVHLFGLSIIPPFFIDIINKAAETSDIRLYLLNPSEEYWGDSISEREISRREKRSGKSAEEMLLYQNHPLLDNLGTLGRDFFDILLEKTGFSSVEYLYEKPEEKSILSKIQAEIFSLEPQKEESVPNDGSITAASCHNPLREVESLYDYLLDAFNTDSTLKPSDILVMCTDVKTYAPYIRAVFDNPYSEPSAIPYSIADLPGRTTSRPAGVFSTLLELLTGDFSLASVMKVIGDRMVSTVFGISRPLEMAEVLQRNGAFFGFDSGEFTSKGITADTPFTFQRAMRRLALGLAEGSSGYIYSEASGDDVPFSSADDIGGIMRFTELCGIYRKRLAQTAEPYEWCALLSEMTDVFLSKDTEYADDLVFLTSCISKIKKQTESINIKIPSRPVLETLTGMLDEAGGSKGFITGRTTFCAMLPMRSIPFRIICILGLNDSSFPRIKSALEFDLIAKHPRKGDRTQRESDKYLFLETVISAQEKLYLSYTGRSESDNKELVPSILITELLRYLNKRFGISDAVIKHRLHSFSRQYFTGDGRLFTYSRARYNAAKSFTDKKNPPLFCPVPIESELSNEIDTETFERFFMNPPKFFLENVMGIRSEIYVGITPDTECMNLDHLQKFKLKNSALNAALNGRNPSSGLFYASKLGTIPAGGLGEHYIGSFSEYGHNMANAFMEYLPDGKSSMDICCEAGGLKIKGRIDGTDGKTHIYTKTGLFKAKDITRAWIRHLLLNTVSPVKTIAVSDESRFSIAPCAPDETLSSLAELFIKGRKQPLYFHPSDGFKAFAPDALKIREDKYSSITAETSFSICFRDEERKEELYAAAEKIYARLLLLCGAAG